MCNERIKNNKFKIFDSSMNDNDDKKLLSFHCERIELRRKC